MFWNTLIFVLVSQALHALAEKRSGVVKVGTTFKPDLERVTGRPLGICPESHPYAFDEGKHCCMLPVKWNDTSKATDCDGMPIRHFSSKECCMPDVYVECDNKEMGCKSFNIDWCVPNPVIHSYDPVWGNWDHLLHPKFALLDDDCDDYGNMWIMPDGVVDKGFIVDFGCIVVFDKVILRQTADTDYNRRGTKDFVIETSMDLGSWMVVLEDVLGDLEPLYLPKCDRRIYETYEDLLGYGRYLKFTAKSHYTLSAGLNNIKWHYLI